MRKYVSLAIENRFQSPIECVMNGKALSESWDPCDRQLGHGRTSKASSRIENPAQIETL
jgi:hypothetical protein